MFTQTKTSSVEKRVEALMKPYRDRWADTQGYISRKRVDTEVAGLNGFDAESRQKVTQRIIRMSGLPDGAELHILSKDVAMRVLGESRLLLEIREENERKKTA